MDATVLLLLGENDAATLCGLLGVDPADEMAASALGEIGNIVGASYINALGAMTGPRDGAGAAAVGDRHARRDRRDRARRPRRAATTSRSCSTPTSRSRARTARSPSCSSRRSGGVQRAPDPPRPGRLRHGRDHGPHGRARVLRGCGRRARLARPGLVHRPRPARPQGGRRRPGPRRAARGRGPRGRPRASSPTPPCRRCWTRSSALGARRTRARGRPRRRREHVLLRRRAGSRSASATTPPCAPSSRKLRIPVAAADTGGSRGRTVRVRVDDGRVTSRAAGDDRGRSCYPHAACDA